MAATRLPIRMASRLLLQSSFFFSLLHFSGGASQFWSHESASCNLSLRLKGGNQASGALKPVTEDISMHSPTSNPAKHDREELIVPTDFTNIEEAVENCQAGDRLFVRTGAYQWPGMAIVRAGIEVTGEEEACLLGRWLLYAGHGGIFRGVSCAYRLPHDELLEHACITVYTSEWTMLDSEIRSVGTTSLRLIERANVDLRRCNLGGLEPVDSLLAKNAVSAMHASRCALVSCGIDDTGDPSSRPPRTRRGRLLRTAQRRDEEQNVCGGIRALNKAVVTLEECHLSNNDIALHVADSARIRCVRSSLRAGEFACFSASASCEPPSTLDLSASDVSGQRWLDPNRPANLLGDQEALEVIASAPPGPDLEHEPASALQEMPPKRGRGRPSRKAVQEQQRGRESLELLLATHNLSATFDEHGALLLPAEALSSVLPGQEDSSQDRSMAADPEGGDEVIENESVIGGGEGEGMDSSATANWGEDAEGDNQRLEGDGDEHLDVKE